MPLTKGFKTTTSHIALYGPWDEVTRSGYRFENWYSPRKDATIELLVSRVPEKLQVQFTKKEV